MMERLAEVLAGMVGRLVVILIDAALIWFIWNLLVEDGLPIVAITYAHAILIRLMTGVAFDFNCKCKDKD